MSRKRREGAMGRSKWVAAVLCAFLMWGQTAYAFEWKQSIKDLPGNVLSYGWTIIRVADTAMHWTWDKVHNKLVHPLVNVVTMGQVDLDTTDDGTE